MIEPPMPDWFPELFDLLQKSLEADSNATFEMLREWEQAHQPAQSQPKRQRKPTLASALKQAAKAGKPVKSAMVGSEGVALEFGEPELTEASNPWLADLNKVSRQ